MPAIKTTSCQVETSEAYKNRVDAAFRRLLVSALGMAAEDPLDRYVATSGELRRYLSEFDSTTMAQLDTAYDAVLGPYRAAQVDKLFSSVNREKTIMLGSDGRLAVGQRL